MTVDPTGRYLYVTNYYDNDASRYTIGVDGSLSPLSPQTIALNPTGISTAY